MNNNTIELTQERLKELVNYNQETGDFTWLVRTSNRIKPGDIARCMSHGYIRIGIDGKNYKAHRIAFIYMMGLMPLEVDHINHKRDDNRWINLRAVTRTVNSQNKSMQCNNTSGVTGVYLCKKTEKWVSEIMANGVYKYLGRFIYKKNAEKARKKAEIKYNFHKNHGAIK